MILVIAEIGQNHNGDVELAKRLIDAAYFASWAGAGQGVAVKFQKRTPALCVPESMRGEMRDTPWGRMPYLDYRDRLELGEAEYDELHEYAAERKMPLFMSVWDEPSLAFALSYDPEWIKIPSALLTDAHLVRKAARSGRHVIVSTGMSTMDEVKVAETILRQNATAYTFLHCHSCYPAPRDELNLKVIPALRKTFLCDVGYSSHEPGIDTAKSTVMLGATMIEKHLTLDRSMWGSDHESSIEPLEFARLVANVRSFERALGDGEKRVWPSEQLKRDQLRPQVTA